MEQILFIAPSQAMVEMGKKICAEMGLSMAVEVASSQQTLEVVLENYPAASVIISRGGIVEALQKITDKTVVAITFTVQDFLLPIHKLAMAGITNFGVIVADSAFNDRDQDYKMGNVDIYIRTWKHKEQVKSLIESLMAIGVKGIVGDKTSVEVAKSCSLAAEFLNSGPAALKEAICEALRIAKAQESERAQETAKAQKIKKCADEIYHSLEYTAAAIQQLTASSEQFAATSQEAANMVMTAAREVKNTTEILNMIRRVAQQTNLLGLNASIEAARVGEQGRGFSVVANEVRKLAEDSNNSVQNINAILEKIRTAVEQVLVNVNQNNETTQQQANAVQDIAQMMESLKLTGQSLMEMAKVKS
jgi:hypothetical protein